MTCGAAALYQIIDDNYIRAKLDKPDYKITTNKSDTARNDYSFTRVEGQEDGSSACS